MEYMLIVLDYVKNILYFFAGAYVSVAVFSVFVSSFDLKSPEFIVYLFSVFILWCWLFSNLTQFL